MKPQSSFGKYKVRSMRPIPYGDAVWCTILNRQYGVEVVRLKPFEGELRVFDLDNKKTLVHQSSVGISYDDAFGAISYDSKYWHKISVQIVEGFNKEL